MTDSELRDQAVAQLKATTVSYPEWTKRVAAGRYTPKDGSGTAWGKAFSSLAQIGVVEPPPPPPPPPPSPPPVGNVIKVSGTISPSALSQQIAAAPAGALTVLPADGQVGFTVSGDLRLARSNVTFQKAAIRDVIADNQGDGFVFDGCTIHSFLLRGVDNWVIRNCQVPFNGVTYGPQQGFDVNGGSIMFECRNWQILSSTFTGCYVAANPGQHTEAWYIGTGNDGGLIKDCTFDNNGSTAHLFFTWWDDQANPPKNICVTSTTFTRSRNPYFHICVHPDIWRNNALNIRFDPNNTYGPGTSYKIGNEYGELTEWTKACTVA